MIHEAHAIGGYNGESPIKMAAAYAAFANGGYYIEPHSFTKIIYRDTSEEYTRQFVKRRAMSVETAYMVADMLVDTSVSALGTYSNIGGATFAAKTGTTNFSQQTIKDYGLSSRAVNDLWVTGFNNDYAMSVWYGYDHLDKEHPEYRSRMGACSVTKGNIC
jgi:penicillin-binding protein 1A